MAALDEINDYKDRTWRRNDRVRLYPLGEGKITAFVSAGLARVAFDSGLYDTVATAGLVLVRRRRPDEIPLS